MKIFFVQFFCVFCHLFLVSSASVRSIPFLPFILPMFAWSVPLVSLIFLKRSLVFPILLFSSISLHWSLRKPFLSPCYSLELQQNWKRMPQIKNKWAWDFSGGPVVKNLPANAGDMGLIPGPGRSCMPRGNCACRTQVLSPSPRAHAPQEKPLQWEAHAPQLESSLCSSQLEKACVQPQRPRAAKNKSINRLKLFPFSKRTVTANWLKSTSAW